MITLKILSDQSDHDTAQSACNPVRCRVMGSEYCMCESRRTGDNTDNEGHISIHAPMAKIRQELVGWMGEDGEVNKDAEPY